jgi:hypothetical protein
MLIPVSEGRLAGHLPVHQEMVVEAGTGWADRSSADGGSKNSQHRFDSPKKLPHNSISLLITNQRRSLKNSSR